MSTVQQQLAGLGFTERSIKVITASWREGTTVQYQSHLKKWIEFCKEKKCNVLSPDLPVVLDLLSMLHENSAFLEGVDFKVNLFVNPLKWTKVSNSQIHFISIKNMELSDCKCTFVITEKVKQSRVGTHLKPVEFLAYPEEEKLCVIKLLQEYVKKTEVLRSDCSQLLLSHVKPRGPASKDTISRWCKNVLKSAGIDVSKFTAHSLK